MRSKLFKKLQFGQDTNSPDEQKVRDTDAGYNGGCGALAASSSCAGRKPISLAMRI